MEAMDTDTFAPICIDDIVFGNDEAKMRITEIITGYSRFLLAAKTAYCCTAYGVQARQA
jgi:hypothetical protein